MNRWIEWWGVELNVVSLREKLVSIAGGALAMVLLVFAARTLPDLPGGAGLVASMGASAVLLFAVPHGQLSQPWPVLAGHVVSAAIGVACARWITPVGVAAACAVGLSIGAMHSLKCIHPPGGATALTAVLGGEAVRALGFQFVLLPVAPTPRSW
jgi:CBS-domain-containing membrane protein